MFGSGFGNRFKGRLAFRPANPFHDVPSAQEGSPGQPTPIVERFLSSKPSVQVVCVENQAGLERDMRVAMDVLRRNGFEMRSISPKDFPRYSFDANIFMEVLEPRFLESAGMNFLVPNPEWFLNEWRTHLPRIIVVCKTRDALDIFSRLGARTELSRWTSLDRYRKEYPREKAFLHLAGKSSYKGTETVWKTWSKHPEWPPLVIVVNPALYPQLESAPNILIVRRYLSEGQLIELQNTCQFHVCPSEYEGYGHYIMEGLSCGAIVLTTGAPPMNELVSELFGFHVPVESTVQIQEAQGKRIGVGGLESAVERALRLSGEEIRSRRRLARAAYKLFRESFEMKFPEIFKRLLAGH